MYSFCFFEKKIFKFSKILLEKLHADKLYLVT